MQSIFNAFIAGTSYDLHALCERLYEPVFMLLDRACREQGLRFRYRRLTTHNGASLFRAPSPIICIIGNVDEEHGATHGDSGAQFRVAAVDPVVDGARRLAEVEMLLDMFGDAAEQICLYIMGNGLRGGRLVTPRAVTGDPNVERLNRLLQNIPAHRCSIRKDIGSLTALSQWIRQDLLAVLERRCVAGRGESEWLQGIHDAIAKAYCADYLPVEEYLEHLNLCLESMAGPVVVTGESGIGKSALLADWSERVRRRHPDVTVIRHFIEADGEAASHGAILRHVLSALRDRDMFHGAIPPTLEDMEELFQNWIVGHHAGRVIIIIDGLDQLCERSQGLRWLPRQVSPKVHLAVSAASGRACDATNGRGWGRMEMRPLPDELRKKALARFVRRGSGRIANDIFDRIVSESRNDTVLSLRGRVAAAEEGFIEDHESMMDAVLSRSPDVAIDYMLARLQSSAARKLLRLLWGSRRGLSGIELGQLMNISEDKVTFLLNCVRHLVVRRGDLIALAHVKIRIAVERNLIGRPPVARKIHRMLASYFSHHILSRRRTEETSWQWFQAEAWDELRACIEDLATFSSMVNDGRDYELLTYWRVVADAVTMATAYRESVEHRFAVPPLRSAEIVDVISLLEQLGTFLSSCGVYSDAEVILERSMTLRSEYLTSDPIGLELAKALLGETLRRAGQLSRAVELLDAAYSSLCCLPEVDAEDLAQVSNDLGLALRDAGGARALDCFRGALRSRQEKLGVDHPSTAETLNDMALVYHDRGNFRAAIGLYQGALEIQRHLGCYDHPSTATYLNNLAGARRGLGHPATALTLYLQALDMRERLLGHCHPHTLVTRINLASVHYERGDCQEARSMCEDVRRDTAGALDDDHPYYLSINLNLAQVLRLLGENDVACKLLFVTLEACRRTLGAYHLMTATCLHNFVSLLRRLERYEEARYYVDDAIEAWRRVHGPNNPQASIALYHRACVLSQLGEVDAAAGSCREALEIEDALYGSGNPRALPILYLLDDMGFRDEACEKLELYVGYHSNSDDDTVRAARARIEEYARLRNQR